MPDQWVSTADQKWHFHFPQCPAQSTAISQLQRYRSGRDHDYKSQFPTVQFSMPLVWRRRRERETSYMLGLTAVFAPSPLGGGACGACRPPQVGWDCGRTRAPPQGVAWAGLWRGGERWRRCRPRAPPPPSESADGAEIRNKSIPNHHIHWIEHEFTVSLTS